MLFLMWTDCPADEKYGLYVFFLCWFNTHKMVIFFLLPDLKRNYQEIAECFFLHIDIIFPKFHNT